MTVFEIYNSGKKVELNEYPESRNTGYKKESNRFLNISPKNYIKSISDLSTKKAIIPMLLIGMMDKDNKIMMTLDEISEIIEYPKTGLSNIFGDYKKNDFMIKVRNGVYMINPLVSYRGSKYERDKLYREYSEIKGEKVSKWV